MEFDSYLGQLQGCLMSAQNTLGPLCDLDTDKHGDGLDKLCETLQRKFQQWKDKEIVRKASLYLILNSNLNCVEGLEDEMCGHLVGTAPTVNSYVLVKLFLNLDDQSILQEIITFCPAVLSTELIDAAKSVLDTLPFCSKTNLVSSLLKSCFHKLVLSEAASTKIQQKFFNYFEIFLLHYGATNTANIDLGRNDPMLDLGLIARNLLALLCFCLDPELKNRKVNWEGYDIQMSPKYEDWPVTGSASCQQLQWECKHKLLNACVNNLSVITIDIFLSWAEIDFDSSKTLQQSIGEQAYKCRELVHGLEGPGNVFPCKPELLAVLSAICIKPKDENDEIEEATLEIIILNINDPTKNKKIWLNALAMHQNVLETEETIGVLKTNAHIFDEDIVSYLLERIVNRINTKHIPCQETLRKLPNDLMKHLSLNELTNILEKLFYKSSTTLNLADSEFPTYLKETFNKAVTAMEGNDELACEVVRLCIQNPIAVIEHALNEALRGVNQAILVAKLLAPMRVVVHALVLDSLNEILSCCQLTECINTSFPILVCELLNQDVLHCNSFLKACLMPTLFSSLKQEEWNRTKLCLSMLNNILEIGMVVPGTLQPAVLLFVLAQILESTIQAMSTFSQSRILVRDETLRVLKQLGDLLERDKSMRTDLMWLEQKMQTFSSITRHHLETIISLQTTNEQTKDCSTEPQRKNVLLETMPETLDRSEAVSCKLVEILPTLTIEEWKMYAGALRETLPDDCDHHWWIFKVFHSAVLLLTIAGSSADPNSRLEPVFCINHCLRNFGAVIKYEVLPGLGTSHYLDVLMNSFLLLENLSAPIFDPASAALLSVLIEILPIVCNTPSNEEIVNATVSLLPEGNARSLLCQKLVKKNFEDNNIMVGASN